MKRERILFNYCADAVRRLTELRGEAETALIDAGSIDFMDKLEDDPFQWISLQLRDSTALSYLPKITDAQAEPYQRVAGLLELLQKNISPTELRMQGMTTLIRDNKVHFCISGSIPLESLQMICERGQELLDPRHKK